MEKLRIPEWRKHSNSQIVLLYPSLSGCSAVCISTGRFLCFYNTFEITVITSEYPEWLREKIEKEPKVLPVLAGAVLFRKIVDMFRQVEKRPNIRIFTTDEKLHYWFMQDSASDHYLTTSITSTSQNILRSYLRNEDITIEHQTDMFGAEQDKFQDVVSMLENAVRDLGIPVKKMKLKKIAVEAFQ